MLAEHFVWNLATCWYKIVNSFAVDGEWSSWIIGPCSKTCGGGIQTKTRVCDDECGGGKCKGSSTSSIKCNDVCCPGKILVFSN